jgi:hypothetical protein
VDEAGGGEEGYSISRLKTQLLFSMEHHPFYLYYFPINKHILSILMLDRWYIYQTLYYVSNFPRGLTMPKSSSNIVTGSNPKGAHNDLRLLNVSAQYHLWKR